MFMEVIAISAEELRAEFVPRTGFAALSGSQSMQKWCEWYFFLLKPLLIYMIELQLCGKTNVVKWHIFV